MTLVPDGILKQCVRMEEAILEVIALQARWEIWLQVELGRYLKRKGWDVRLEVDYGFGRKRLDILLEKQGVGAAIELKVESSTKPGSFGGSHLYHAGGDDIFKLQEARFWPNVSEENKFGMVVAYSEDSITLLRELARDQPPSHYAEGKQIGVAVYRAYYY